MANLRYAQSGHKKRVAHVEERRARAVSAPAAKKTLALLGLAALLPVALCFALAALVERDPPPPLASDSDNGPARLPDPAPPIVLPPPVVVPPPPTKDITESALQKDEALSSALARVGIGSEERSALVRAVTAHLDARTLREGAAFIVEKDLTGALERFELKAITTAGIPRTIFAQRQPDPITEQRSEPVFDVRHEDAPIEVTLASVSGSVRSSLYQAMLEGGEEPALVDKFVDVFAWNVDFYRQTQKGDTYKVLVEKRRAGGRFLGYGRVLAAEYDNAGTVHRGFLFASKDGQHAGTYDAEGDALMRTFLKSPMEVARITSSYGMRFHPVLGKNKAHQGVDYGAPTGTPVWSVADGVVVEARYSKTAGNMIVLKHMNGFTTEYFHLSKFADGIAPGARIKQKQVLGAVGSTGMSTGPHLHFGMQKSGAHVDPHKQKFPNAKPVPKEYATELQEFVAPLMAELQALDRA